MPLLPESETATHVNAPSAPNAGAQSGLGALFTALHADWQSVPASGAGFGPVQADALIANIENVREVGSRSRRVVIAS